jgi:ABC-2 type transport system permease protein
LGSGAKESLQALRDPSTLLIAFVLPVVLLLLFAYAVSLDARGVRVGVVQESPSAPQHTQLAAAFAGTRFLDAHFAHDRREVADRLVSGSLRGFVVIPQDFEQRLANRGSQPLVQIITDGSQPNTANYVDQLCAGRRPDLAGRPRCRGIPAGRNTGAALLVQRRTGKPPFARPGAIAIVMTIIGTMLTALVVAREWERGTMEAVLSTPASVVEILIGKLCRISRSACCPRLAQPRWRSSCSTCRCVARWPRCCCCRPRSWFRRWAKGLLISSVTRNQFLAAQIALFSGFLPAFMLSGFLYEIDAMPAPIRAITRLIPARYFVDSLKTIFLAGDIWAVFVPNLAWRWPRIGILFFLLAKRATRKNLE